jgi:hypothetical protein
MIAEVAEKINSGTKNKVKKRRFHGHFYPQIPANLSTRIGQLRRSHSFSFSRFMCAARNAIAFRIDASAWPPVSLNHDQASPSRRRANPVGLRL